MGWRVVIRFLALLMLVSCARAEVPLSQFVQEAFPDSTPQPQMLWLTPPVKQRAAAILGHDFAGLRTKYWRAGERTAWVLDEIGKERPITIGVVVERGQVVQVRVLAYRESRGGEVRHAFFTRQFEAATLKGVDKLDRHIDGITGATLSVNAMTRVTRLALAFHDEALRAR